MPGKREIKCPECGKWTMWQGGLHDRCLYCNAFLEKHAFITKVEKDISNQVKAEDDLLFIHPDDSVWIRTGKKTLRFLRTVLRYLQIAFVAFISFILWLLSLLAG